MVTSTMLPNSIKLTRSYFRTDNGFSTSFSENFSLIDECLYIVIKYCTYEDEQMDFETTRNLCKIDITSSFFNEFLFQDFEHRANILLVRIKQLLKFKVVIKVTFLRGHVGASWTFEYSEYWIILLDLKIDRDSIICVLSNVTGCVFLKLTNSCLGTSSLYETLSH